MMACDLSLTPYTGLNIAFCGDFHLLYFGSTASPKRKLNF